MTLLEECKALDEVRFPLSAYDGTFQDGVDEMKYRLRTVLSRHEHDDWKGRWVCEDCGAMYGPEEAEQRNYHCIFKHKTGDVRTVVPYERRKGERRKA